DSQGQTHRDGDIEGQGAEPAGGNLLAGAIRRLDELLSGAGKQNRSFARTCYQQAENGAGENEVRQAQAALFTFLIVLTTASIACAQAAPAADSGGWFRADRINAVVLMVLFSAAIMYYTQRAKRGEKLFIRK